MPDRQPRKWRRKGFFPFRMEVLTPVFIGSGTTLSPLEYVIRAEHNTHCLCRIDLQSWLMEHALDQSVQAIIASGDIARIRRMLDEKVDAADFALSSSPIADAALADELRRAFGGQPAGQTPSRKTKTGDVDAAMRNVLDNCLYIPGSSLKGALSTPLINWLDILTRKQGRPSLKDAVQKNPKNGMDGWLQTMFGSIGNHAMQALKVSDVSAPFAACAIVRAKERSKNPDKKGTPKPPCEVIMPNQSGMWGRLMLDSAGKEPAVALPNGTRVTLPEIIRRCNTFYKKRFADEMRAFYELPHFADVRAALREVEVKIHALTDSALLLRVGHYSHVESVTVENRQPKPRVVKGKPMPVGTTRTLADGRLPFGWIILHFCSLEEYEKGMRETEKFQHAAIHAQIERLDSHKENATQAAFYARQQEERRFAAEQKAAEERKKTGRTGPAHGGTLA